MRTLPYMYELNDPDRCPLRFKNLEHNERQVIAQKILEANSELIQKILASRKLSDHPEIGEFLLTKDSGLMRFTVVHPGSGVFQVTEDSRSNFYLWRDGSCEHAGMGGLNMVKGAEVELSGEVLNGLVWMFDRGITTHGNRIDLNIPFRVWRFK